LAAGLQVLQVIAQAMLAMPLAWHAQAGEVMTDAYAGSAGASRQVSPHTGTGAPGPASLPRTLTEAAAQHAETVRKCAELPVAAVRQECLREAKRVLDREVARLRAAGPPGTIGR